MRSLARALVVACVLAPAVVRADEAHNIASASEAYDIATALHKTRDYARAAAFFARADELAPNDVALEEAIKSTLLADAAPFAMDLVARVERGRGGRVPSPELASAAREARARFARRVGRVVVVGCSEPSCATEIDGKESSAAGFVTTGTHAVVVRSGDSVLVTKEVFVAPEAVVQIAVARSTPLLSAPQGATATGALGPDTPASPSRAEGASGTGISPTWFWLSVAASGLVAGATAASALDFDAKRSAFDDEPTDARASNGRAAQNRTNALLITTGALALLTGAIGLFWVDWAPRPTAAGRPLQLGARSGW